MLLMQYLDEGTKYSIEFRKHSKNVVEIVGDIPVKICGFTLSREGKHDNFDYSGFTTIFRKQEGSVLFSNDESVYIEPEPAPEPEPYVPTLKELKSAKLSELNGAKEAAIAQGFNATLTDGTTEHFDLSGDAKLYLTALRTEVLTGSDPIPWHVSDSSVACKNYSNADMNIITQTALNLVVFHETYIFDITRYVNSIETEEELSSVYYGMSIPEEYQSEPLKDMLAQMS